MQIPYARFVQIGRTIGEAMADDMLDEYKLAAYGGWQNYLTQMMAWGGKKKPKTFKEWMVYLRLSEADKPLTYEEEREIERKALAETDDILKQFQAS